MITILLTQNRIHISGHANTAPRGADIVCSAVSALTLIYKGIEGNRLYEAI